MLIFVLMQARNEAGWSHSEKRIRVYENDNSRTVLLRALLIVMFIMVRKWRVLIGRGCWGLGGECETNILNCKLFKQM